MPSRSAYVCVSTRVSVSLPNFRSTPRVYGGGGAVFWIVDQTPTEGKIPRDGVPAGPAQGVLRLGSRGNIEVLRMFGSPRNSIATRSMPTPPPACGNEPYLKPTFLPAQFGHHHGRKRTYQRGTPSSVICATEPATAPPQRHGKTSERGGKQSINKICVLE